MKDYMNLSATLPFRLDSNTAFSQSRVGDVDGDGREEILLPGRSVNVYTLGLISYFNYGDVSHEWPDSQSKQLAVMTTVAGTIAGGAGTSLPLLPTNQYYLADVDGDGSDEVVTWNPFLGVLAVSKWQNTDEGSGVKLLWKGQPIPADPFASLYLADLDGDGCDEVVAWDPSALTLTVLKWQNSELAQLWQAKTLITSDSGTRVLLGPHTALCCAKLYGGGDQSAAVVAWNPDSGTRAVLKWQNSALEILSVVGVSEPITMTMSNQLYAADVDGDGADEVLMWDPLTLTLSLSKWQGSGLEPLGPPVIAAIEAAGGLVAFGPENQWFVGDVDGDGGSEIVTLNNSTGNLAVLKWQNSALACVWTNGVNVDEPAAAASSVCLADVDGDGRQEVLVWRPMMLLLDVLEWQDSGLKSAGFVEQTVPGWSLELLVAGPKNTFADHPFVGTQLEIYQYISREIDKDVDSVGHEDIRADYTNLSLSDDWPSRQSKLEAMENPIYPDADWDAVTGTLAKEFGAVSPFNSLIGSMDSLSITVSEQQLTDLSKDAGNISMASESPVTYWLGQIVEAALWGACAVDPGIAGVQVAMSAFASLFGSALSSPDGSPRTVSYSSLQGDIAETYVTSKDTNDYYQQTVLTDAVMLPLAHALAGGKWSWSAKDADDAVSDEAASNTNRIVFYQALIPAAFRIDYWEGVDKKELSGVGTSAYASWVEPVGGLYNCYSMTSDAGAPSRELCDDLFTTLGIPRSEFFKGTNGWEAIKRVKQPGPVILN